MPDSFLHEIRINRLRAAVVIIKQKRNAASTLLQRSSESSHQTCLTQTKGALRSTLLLLPAAELKPAADVPRVTSPAEAAKKFSQRTLVRELRSKFSFGPFESTEFGFGVLGICKDQEVQSSMKFLAMRGKVGPGIAIMEAPQLPLKTPLSYFSFSLVK